MKMLHIVKYSGPFGFIKPWTAVRDGETFSQQFLTPSTIEGIEKKLFPELLSKKGRQDYIIGHRLNYTGISRQQEQTWSKSWPEKKGVPTIELRRIKKKGIEQFKEVKIPTVIRRPETGILIFTWPSQKRPMPREHLFNTFVFAAMRIFSFPKRDSKHPRRNGILKRSLDLS
jgi:hypothetical protein